MMDKGNKDMHRRTYSGGIKAFEEQKSGRDKARERYGPLRQQDTKPEERSGPQRLGDDYNLQGSRYGEQRACGLAQGHWRGCNYEAQFRSQQKVTMALLTERQRTAQ